MTESITASADAGMQSAATGMSRWRDPPAWALIVLAVAVPVAHAQSANCEAFKERLAATIESNGVRGYALEIVPSGGSVPPGARSLGTCDGGAYTVLYWRWAQARAGATPAAPSAAVADAPAVTPRPAPALKNDAAPRPRREPEAMAEVNASREADATRQNKRSTEPTAARAPQAAATPGPSAAKPSAATDVTVATNPPPAASPAPMAATAASAPAPEPAQAAAPARSADVVGILAFVVAAAAALAGGVWVWRWVRYRRYFDEAGLPRGPRITLR
jgi:hypothetical protein